VATDFILQRNDIINTALRIIGVLPTGEDTSSSFIQNQTNEAVEALQLVLLDLQNELDMPFRVKAVNTTITASTQTLAIDTDHIDILNAFLRIDTSDHLLQIIGRQNYEDIVDKSTESQPQMIFFDKQVASPIITFWPVPDISYDLHYKVLTVFNDFTNGTDDPRTTDNFPERWLRFIVYALAIDLGEQYQIPERDLIRLERKMEQMKKNAIMRDSDRKTSSFFVGSYPN